MHLKTEPIVESDLVLIHLENKPAFYGRVEKISPDVKPKWWRVKFLFLTFPHQITTWIIDDEQIRGADFTMAGTPIRIERVVVPEDESPGEAFETKEGAQDPLATRKARVLSLGNKIKK